MGYMGKQFFRQFSYAAWLVMAYAFLAGVANATTYFVSPSGNNSSTGLTVAAAWASIEQAEVLGVISPGDTVNILPGTYMRTTPVQLITSGTGSLPIVYRRYGRGPAVIDMSGADGLTLVVSASYTEITGVTVANSTDHGIELIGHHNTISDCYIYGVQKHGIRVVGQSNHIVGTIVSNARDDAIRVEGSAGYTMLYNNTLYDAGKDGVEILAHTCRFINNIVVLCSKGINATTGNVLAFNNSWGNVTNYSNVTDSGGGISAIPQFVDATTGRFDLRRTDPGINAGMNVGRPFTGSAPDLGAIEKYQVYYVAPSGSDNNGGRAPSTPWRTLDASPGDLHPGDTVKLSAGTYVDSLVVRSSGLLDDRLTFVGVPELTEVNADGRLYGVQIVGSHILWSGTTVQGAIIANIQIAGEGVEISSCAIGPSSTSAVAVTTGKHASLLRCTFFGNQVSDLSLSADSASIRHCTFFSVRYGIDALGSAHHNIENNVFLGEAGASAAIRTSASSAVVYSILHGYNQTLQGGATLGLGCLLTDPLLFAPGAGNLHLSSYSPAIDAGISTGVPFVGLAPDMGAYETQTLTNLEIVPHPVILSADSLLQFDVIALGADGFPSSPGTLTWSHTFSTGSISNTGLYTPQLVGTGAVHVQSSIGSIVAATGTFTVGPGNLAGITVSAPAPTVSADSVLQLTASGADGHGNPVALGTGTLWAVTEPIGSINSNGLFIAGRVGRGTVTATADGVTGISDTIEVIAGEAVFLEVLPANNVVQLLQSYQYAAFTYDADSNIVSDITSLATWSTSDLSGSINGNGLYSAGTILGDYRVVASMGLQADTGQVSVALSGGLSYIRIERLDGIAFGDSTLSTDQDHTRLYARGYNSGGSLIGDVVVTWSLVSADSIGSLSAQNSATTMLSLRRPGTGKVIAVHSLGYRDTTGIITCTAGAPARLQVSPAADTVSADSSLQFTYTAFDADNNPTALGVAAVWQTRGQIGSVSAGGLFTPTFAGSGSIICSGAGLADTSSPLMVVPGSLSRILITPDQLVLSADSTKQFVAGGYDQKGNTCPAGSITWSLLTPPGTISVSGMYTPNLIGTTSVIARSSFGPADTTTSLRVVAGRLVQLTLSPDSTVITTDSHIDFSATGSDSHGNTVVPGSLAWLSMGGVGTISSRGTYTPVTIGNDRIIATDSLTGIADTCTYLEVRPGQLKQLVIAPNQAVLRPGDQILCSATGYDATFNETATGAITWSVIGSFGSIASNGLLTAAQHGFGNVVARSNAFNIADTSDIYAVEALEVSAVPIGSLVVHPGARVVPALTMRISNPYGGDKFLDRLILKHNHRGRGSAPQLISNIESVLVYLDRDGDLSLSAQDSLLIAQAPTVDSVTVVLGGLPITALADRTLIVATHISPTATDADTIDFYVLSSTGLLTADLTPAIGLPTINSTGQIVVNGMVAAQIRLSNLGQSELSTSDTLIPVFGAYIPRNGYAVDTLRSVRLVDVFQCDATTFDSLILFADDGDGLWGGRSKEMRLGELVFTGADYLRSGLQLNLIAPFTQIYVAAALGAAPINGTQFAFGIPTLGIEVRSGNDGPVDQEIPAADTFMIRTADNLAVTALSLPPRTLRPNVIGGPLLSLRLRNYTTADVRLDSIEYHLRFDGHVGASDVQLLSQVESLYVYRSASSDYSQIGAQDALLKAIEVSSTSGWIDIDDLSIPGSGGSATVGFFALLRGERARNGNLVGLDVPSVSSLAVDGGVAIDGSFPIRPNTLATIDVFSSTAIVIGPVPNAQLRAGQTNQIVMSLALPRNGYASDRLRSLQLINIGTLPAPSAISSFKLWRDLTGNGLSPDDQLVGLFTYSNGVWRLQEVSAALNLELTQFLVTASIESNQFEGGTLALVIPQGGISYWSGTTGPDDQSITNSAVHLVLPSDRVTVISVPVVTTRVIPGEANRQLLTFALYNGYQSQSKALTGLTLTNLTRSAQSNYYRDVAVGNITISYDADNNRVLDNDIPVASGFFVDGTLRVNGLSVTLPPESLSYFFAVTDVPLAVSDGDSLAIGIAQAGDITISDAAILNGDLPLSSGGYFVVDGAVEEQYRLLPVKGGTLRPGDTAVLFAFTPASNGSLSDVLTSLTIVNLSDADPGEIARLSLWQDADGDHKLASSDLYIDDLQFANGGWQASGLASTIGPVPSALFVVAEIDSNVTPNAGLRLAIPVGGCRVTSGNDGPLDNALQSGQTFTLSNAGLVVRVEDSPVSYTVGQSIVLNFRVNNRLPRTVADIRGMMIETSDSSLIRLDSSLSGPLPIGAGDSALFTYYFAALAPGNISWRFRAISPAGDSSSLVTTSSFRIDSRPTGVAIALISSVPAAASRGQSNIFPLQLRCTHLDTDQSAALVRLDSLTLGVENLDGLPVTVNSVFNRLILSSGLDNRHFLDSVPSSATVTFGLPHAFVLQPGSQRSLVLQGDIDSTASAEGFRVVLQNAGDVGFVDDNSGQAVTVAPSQPFPIRTAMCRINDPSPYLFVSSNTLLRKSVNGGQQDVATLRVYLRHAGTAQSSSVQLTSVTVRVLDSLGQPLWPSDLFSGLKVIRSAFTLGEKPISTGDPLAVTIMLNSPLNLSAGQIDSVTISARIKSAPNSAGFRLAIADSTALQIRDLNTGNVLSALSDTGKLATDNVFPMMSDYARILQPSAPPIVCIDLNVPPQVAAGADSVNLVHFSVTNGGTSQQSPVRINHFDITITDSSGRPTDIAHSFDRLGYRLGAADIQYVSIPPGAVFGTMRIPMGITGVVINGGEKLEVQIVGDLDASPAEERLIVQVRDENFVAAHDFSDESRLNSAVGSGCDYSFPLRSTVAEIFSPAGRPLLTLPNRDVLLTHPGARDQELAQVNFTYSGTNLQGNLELEALHAAIMQRTPDGLANVPANELFDCIHLTINRASAAIDSAALVDSLLMTLKIPYAIPTGASVEIAILGDVRADAPLGNYLLIVADSNFAVLKDKQRHTAVYSYVGAFTYPLYGTEIAITASNLAGSFTNYPNPFIPSRGQTTTIGYSLTEGAYVDIELFTIGGELVRRVTVNEWRASGSHSSDRWDGVNSAGKSVVSGTYFCRISAHYASGRAESFMRKVAVIR